MLFPRGTSQSRQAGTTGLRVGAREAQAAEQCWLVTVLSSYPCSLLDIISSPLAIVRLYLPEPLVAPLNSSWKSWLLPPPKRKPRRGLEELWGRAESGFSLCRHLA